MKLSLAFVATTCLVLNSGAAAQQPQAPPEPAGMRQLFDGKGLSDWDGDRRLWSVKDGVIHGETTEQNPAKGNTFLIWKGGQVKDFDLRLSFRLNATNNSGIQYRSRHITDGAKVNNNWVVRGYQHELRNESKLPSVSGFIYDEGGRRGRVCLVGEQAVWKDGMKQVTGTLIDQEGFEKLFKLDDWNETVILCRGNHIQHYLNGRLILDFTDDPEVGFREGILALQLHAGKPMWAEFKNIRLKDL